MTRRELVVALALGTALVACDSGPSAPPFNPLTAPRPGQDRDGGLGDGGLMIEDDVLGGTALPEPPDDFVAQWATIEDPDQICAGWHHSCGIRMDGTAACWGADNVGQSSPPQDETFVKIGCGDNNACGITDDGRLVCWGVNDFGQTDSPTDGEYTEVDCGEVHCCAIDVQDRVVCWGTGGPDGDDLPPDYGQATAPPGLYRGITTGKAHSCAIELGSDEVVCWGGAGNDCFPPRGVQCGQANPPPGAFKQVAAGFTHSCGVTAAGTLECWGQGRTAGSCNPYSGGTDYACAQSASIDGVFEKVTAGDFHTCVIGEDFELQCQGWERSLGTLPTGLFSQIAGGAEHSCGIRRNGTAACWGNGPAGQTTVSGFPGSQ